MSKNTFVYYKNKILPTLKTTENLQNSLFEAIFHEKSLQKAQELLSKGAFIDYRYDPNGTTLFFLAKAHSEVNFLIELGANINAKDKNGQSVLGETMDNSYISLNFIKVLLKHGADINAQGPCGQSPLYCATIHAHYRNFALIDLLMEFGGNIQGLEKYWQKTPLFNAMYDKKCFEILIKYAVLRNQEKDCMKIIDRNAEIKLWRNGQIPEAKKYVEMAVEERERMKGIFVSKKISLYTFLTEFQYQKCQISKELIQECKVYGEIIRKMVHRERKRSVLLRQLNDICINSRSSDKIVGLDVDSRLEIVKKLDNYDLKCLIKAISC